MSLNDIFIRQLKPPERGQKSYPDETLPGFALRVSQGGTKTFVLVHGRTRCRTTIGRYPIISLAVARAKAREILAEITLGTHKPKSLTFQDAFDIFIAQRLPQNRPSTAKETERLIRKALGRFTGTPLSSITTPDLAAFLDRTTEKAHVHTALATFFNWCLRRGYIEQSPMSRLQKARLQPRERTLSPPELQAVLLACGSLGRYGQLIRFLIYTGQRYGQALTLTEKHINRQTMTLSWPASGMKAGRPHAIPYGPLTAELLDNLVTLNGRFFPTTRKMHPRLMKASGVTGFSRHDLRRTFATLHAQIGTPQHIVERLLAHAVPGGSAIHLVYNRFKFSDEQKAACLHYEQFLCDLMDGTAV